MGELSRRSARPPLRLAASAVVGSQSHQLTLSHARQAGLLLSFGLVGVVVAWHQPRNLMGWVLLGITFFFILDDLAGSSACS